MQSNNARLAADLLLQARATGQPLDNLPAELLPADAQAAYAIQDLVTASLGLIGGWKTAPSRNGVKFSWAPIPASGVYPDGADIALTALPRCELELEVGLVMKSDLPPRKAAYTREEVVAALGSLCACLELFASRYADRTKRSALEVVADAQSAYGLVIGTGLSDWSGVDLGATELVLDYAGDNHGSAGGRSLDDLLDASTDLANATSRLGGLRAGQVIITGARIGPIPLEKRGGVSGQITSVGAVGIQLT